ncbi:MAG: DEAD/DEAH box helicase [Candidatus Methanofastidiosia archaeon]|jgi:replicative superfamily II helicase
MKIHASNYLIPSSVKIERLLFEPHEKQMRDALAIKSYLEDFIRNGFVTEHHSLNFRLYYLTISGLAAETPYFDIVNHIRDFNISLSDREFEEFRKLYSVELASNIVETLREFLLENFEQSMRKSKVIVDWLDRDENFKIEDNFIEPTPQNNFNFSDVLELTDDLLRMIYVISSWIMKAENKFGEREILIEKTDALSKSFIARDVPSWFAVLAFSLCRYSIAILNHRSIRTLIERMEMPMEIYEHCISEKRFSFNRHQLLIMNKGLFDRAHILASCPPGSGKTFLASLHSVINECNGHTGKTVFAVPLIALANEVHSWIESIAPEYLQITLQTSESSLRKRKELAREIGRSRIIIATYERLDSIIRNKFLKENDVHTLLVDEFHNISSKTRGIGLDFLTTSLLSSCQEKFLLSAVIPKQEVKNLAEWTHTIPVYTEKIEKEPEIVPAKLRHNESKKEFIMRHSNKSIQDNYLTLVVCSTRQKCENLAEWVAEGVGDLRQMPLFPPSDYLENIRKKEKLCRRFAQKVLELELDPRKEYRQIAELIQKGIAFHHAGMNRKLKNIIQEAAGQKAIHVLFSTTTLAEGVNLPIKDVLIESIPYLGQIIYYSDIKKEIGSHLSAEEKILINGILSTYTQNLKNVFGRAGRPQLEQFSEIISLLPEEQNKKLKSLEKIGKIGTSIDLYVLYDFLVEYGEKINLKKNRQIEKNYKKGRERMRSWLLRLIDVSKTNSEFNKMILKPWFSSSYSNNSKMLNLIRKKIFDDVESLVKEGFVNEDDSSFSLSKLGHITSECLVDPESALIILDFMKKVIKRYNEGILTEYIVEKQKKKSNYKEDKLVRILIFVAMGLSNELIREYKNLTYHKLKKGDTYQIKRLETLDLLPPEADPEFSRFFYATKIATLLSKWRNGTSTKKIEEYTYTKFLAESFIKRIASDESIRILNFISRIGSEILKFPDQFSETAKNLSWQLQFGTYNFEIAKLIEFLTKKELGTRETALVIARETKKSREIFTMGHVREKSPDELSQKFYNNKKARIIFETLNKDKEYL